MKAALVSILFCFIFLEVNSELLGSTDYCNLYGSFYITKNKAEADLIVFIEESEAFADLLVFKEENRLFADRAGAWFFTEQKGFADYYIYLEKSRSMSDFSIFYTDVASLAGCK